MTGRDSIHAPSAMGQELFWWVCVVVQPGMALQMLGTQLRLGLDPKLTPNRTHCAVRPRIAINNEDEVLE